MRITVDGEMRQTEGHQQPRVALNNGRFKSTNEGDVLRLSFILLVSITQAKATLQEACRMHVPLALLHGQTEVAHHFPRCVFMERVLFKVIRIIITI